MTLPTCAAIVSGGAGICTCLVLAIWVSHATLIASLSPHVGKGWVCERPQAVRLRCLLLGHGGWAQAE